MKACEKKYTSPSSQTESCNFSMSVIVTFVFRLVRDRKIQKLYRFIDKFGERTNCISEKQCAVSKKSRKQFENGEQKTQSKFCIAYATGFVQFIVRFDSKFTITEFF